MPTQHTPTKPKLADDDLVRALAAARVHPIIAADIRRRHAAAVRVMEALRYRG